MPGLSGGEPGRAYLPLARRCVVRGSLVPLLATVLALWATPSRAEIIDRALAVVGGVVITQSDARASAELGLASVEGSGDPQAAVLAWLVDRQLMLMEVDRSLPPEPTEEAVTQQLQKVRGRFQSEAEFEKVLRRTGVDEMRLRATLRDQLRIDAYLNQRFGSPPLTAERRAALIKDWVAGLRRRSDITLVEVPRS
jgi:hypothetical protein